MDERRLAAIFARDRGKPSKTSTGYVIATRLLLTAAHAVESAGKIEAQLIDQANPMPCKAVWNGRVHELDVAVLEVDAEYWPPYVAEKPVRFGRLVTLQPAAPAETIGFPAAQRAPDGELETAHVYGHINPGDRLLSGRWVLSVAETSPGDLGSSPWRGISGAPLFSGDLLCGVVVVDPPHWRHGKLDAVQAHRLLQNEEFHSLLRERLGYSPVAEAVELESLAEPVMLSRPPRSLPELLRPQAETVRFSGREGQIAEFLSWCDGGGVMARLLVGPGGQGKTRFARELARMLAAQGWVVVQLRDSAPSESYKILGKVGRRLLLVMDYADTRPGSVAEVMRVLEEEGSRGSVRILLIARSAGEWWDQLPASASAHVSMLSGATVIKLDALADTLSTRQSAYHEALLDLAHGLERLPDYADIGWTTIARALHAPDLSDARLGSPLTLQLHALTDLLAAQPGAQPSQPGSTTVEALFLVHEERYWTRTAGRRLLLRELGASELGDAVAAATLTRAPQKERAVELLASVPSLRDSPERVRTVLAAWLSDLYPASTESYWGALEPDRLGEYHVSARIRDNPNFLKDFLTVLNTDEAVRALTVLARAGAQSVCPCPDLLDQLSALITLHPERLAVPAAYVATQSENPDFLIGALSSLATRSDLPVDLLEDLNTAFPPQTASLAEPALKVAESLIRAIHGAVRRGWLVPWLAPQSHAVQPSLRDSAASATRVSARTAARADLARAYHNYSHRLMGLGKWDEAIDAGEHAIGLYRRLARRCPDPYQAFLAGSLDNQAMALSSANRLDDALRASQQARAVHRALAADSSETHLAGLARSLSNVSGIFDGLRAYQAALNTSTEAVVILSQLADRKPGLYLPELASALHNQASHYARAAWFEDAEAASVRAVAIRRRLAVQRPDANLPGLAHSLQNFSIDLAATEKEEAASKILDESISLYLRLVRDEESSYLPYLANALNTKAMQCREKKEIGKAIIAGARSVVIYMRLAQKDPAEFQTYLAITLRNHRLDLAGAGLVHPIKWGAILKQADTLSQHDLPVRPRDVKGKTLEEDEEIRKLGTEIVGMKETDMEGLWAEAEEILDRYNSETGVNEEKYDGTDPSGPAFPTLGTGERMKVVMLAPRRLLRSWLPRRRRGRSSAVRALYRKQDPRETVDYTYQSLIERLTWLRRSVSDVATKRKTVELKLNSVRKLKITGEGQKKLADLDSQYRMLQAYEERLTGLSQQFQEKVDHFRTQKEVFKATYTTAEAMRGIGEVISRSDGIRRAQDRTTYMQVRAEAANDLMASAEFDSFTGVAREDIRTDLDRIDADIAAELKRFEDEIRNSPASVANPSVGKAHRANAADEPQAGEDS